MKQHMLKVSLLITSLAISATLLYAASVHFKNGPTFTDNGTTLTTCASLAGLGNQDVTITVTTSGSGSTTCTNPGGNVSPGQNKVAVSASVSQTISSSQIKNGNLSFCETTPPPASTSATQAGCPNDTWTATIPAVVFTSAPITVVQSGQAVFHQPFQLP